MFSPKLVRITTVPISLKTLLKGQLRFMSKNGFEVLSVSSPGEELEDVAHDESVRVVALEMTRIISPWKDLKSLWQFYRMCKKEKPLIVHSHTPKAGIVGMLGARLAGVPVRLHTVAGLPLMETSGTKRKILDFVEKLTYRCATKVYPNSKGLYDFILAHHLTIPQKLKVLGNGSSNGIDTSFFCTDQVSSQQREELKEELHIREKDFVFIFVGRLVGDKGINELVQAFQNIVTRTEKQGVRAKLLLVGPPESELDPLLPETLQQIESNPDILSVGFRKDVRPYFAISHALVFPSYREGFPNVVMQAGAMGLPAIVSDINGCNEIITASVNGAIIPAKNSIQLQEAMLQFLDDHVLYQRMAQNSRRMITERYEQQLVWQALLEEYRQMAFKNH